MVYFWQKFIRLIQCSALLYIIYVLQSSATLDQTVCFNKFPSKMKLTQPLLAGCKHNFCKFESVLFMTSLQALNKKTMIWTSADN